MNKKNFIIGAVIIIVLVVIILILRFGLNVDFFPKSEIILTGTYDIGKDYCGKVIDSHYCQCAFEGKNCEAIGIGKNDAYRLVTAGYKQWLVEKQKEECTERGGNWRNGVCRK